MIRQHPGEQTLSVLLKPQLLCSTTLVPTFVVVIITVLKRIYDGICNQLQFDCVCSLLVYKSFVKEKLQVLELLFEGI